MVPSSAGAAADGPLLQRAGSEPPPLGAGAGGEGGDGEGGDGAEVGAEEVGAEEEGAEEAVDRDWPRFAEIRRDRLRERSAFGRTRRHLIIALLLLH